MSLSTTKLTNYRTFQVVAFISEPSGHQITIKTFPLKWFFRLSKRSIMADLFCQFKIEIKSFLFQKNRKVRQNTRSHKNGFCRPERGYCLYGNYSKGRINKRSALKFANLWFTLNTIDPSIILFWNQLK